VIQLRVALLGDIALIGRYDRTRSGQVSERLRSVKSILDTCDEVVANLESPLTAKTTTTTCKGIHLRSDPANVETLRYLNVTAVNLANNHLHDYGFQGMRDTIAVLEKNGIRYFGINNGICFIENGGAGIALDGFCCYSSNGVNYGAKYGQIAVLSERNVERSLSAIGEKGFYGIVSAHFGDENIHYPRVDHISLFRRLSREYHFTLHGHHPHVIQGIERVNGSLLAYSLGNLIFDNVASMAIRNLHYEQTGENKESAIVILEVSAYGLAGCQTIPLNDVSSGIIPHDETVAGKLRLYSETLNVGLEECRSLRDKEVLDLQKRIVPKRDLRFLMNRLSYYYIGAYLNGRRNARTYRSLFHGSTGV